MDVKESEGFKVTTQVVLMNGLGIALASDSAVTAGGKVLNTSEKIFELPAPHKAAVLTSGRARFMGVPWEVLLSAWSETLDRTLASMNDYLDSLYKFLRSVTPNTGPLSVPEIEYIEATFYGEDHVYNTIWKALSDIVHPYFDEKLPPEEMAKFNENVWDEEFRVRMTEMMPYELVEKVSQVIVQATESRRESYQACPDINESQASIWLEKYWTESTEDKTFDARFSGWPTIPNLYKLCLNLHAAFIVHADYSGESNINLVGYGQTDMFPSWSGTYLHGAVRGTILKRFDQQIAGKGNAVDLFFGQDDAISAITGRGDRLLTNAAVESTQRQLNAIMEKLEQSEDEQVLQTKEYIAQSMQPDTIRETMMSAGREQRRNPFQQAISMSPILDLAEFSAQLVGVQAAYAAMTQDNPTVGGFVDVAIITHRRGFEWIRHKH
jgi:hypothetical protein